MDIFPSRHPFLILSNLSSKLGGESSEHRFSVQAVISLSFLESVWCRMARLHSPIIFFFWTSSFHHSRMSEVADE